MSQAAKDFSGQDLRGRNFRRQDLMGANFSYANLRGSNFKGQDLTGANFSNADIRGANFSNAILRGANFRNANAGLIIGNVIFILVIALLWIGFITLLLPNFLVGCLLAIGLAFLLEFGHSDEFSQITGTAYDDEIEYGLKNNLYEHKLGSGFKQFKYWNKFRIICACNLAITNVALFCIVLSACVLVLSVCVLTITAVINDFALLVYKLEFPLWLSWIFNPETVLVSLLIITLILSGFLTFLIKEKVAYKFGKVTFKYADLSDADFTKAILVNTNFRDSKLCRTRWYQIRNYHFFPSKTRLIFSSYLLIYKLVTTGEGNNADFNDLDFSTLNLSGANFRGSSFIRTNLNQSSLQYADLSGAKLKQTQLGGADLTGATLTGAYIEDWGITTETKLDGIKCEYVYMRVPTPDDPNPIRKPDNHNEIFQDGDFADFIRPLTDTLDLYHNQGVDPRAIAIAFKELAENNPEAELRIVAMEVKGKGKFLLRAQTALAVDKSKLSTEYFSTYSQIKGLPEAEIKALLGEKDSRIQSLEAMVVTALQRPSFYSHVERADMVSNNPGGISQSVSGGNVYGGMQAAQGSGNIQSQEIHSIASNEQGLTQEQVIQLFAQLESVLKQPELPGEVQTKAIKYLDAAKEEVQAKEPDKQLAAGNLKRMAETIESTSKTMESGKKIWETTKPVLEALLPWLGVAKGFFGF